MAAKQSFPGIRNFLLAMSKRHPSIVPVVENVANPQQTLKELRRVSLTSSPFFLLCTPCYNL
jgi:hypothetical protein